MKNNLLTIFAITLGISVALIGSAIAMYAMGQMKRSPSGSPVLGMPNIARPTFALDTGGFDLAKHQREQEATRALLISDIKWVRQRDNLGLTFEAENVKDHDLDTAVAFKVVFMQGSELKGVMTAVAQLAIPAKSRKLVTSTVATGYPEAFDSLKISMD
jgi:hypothetical protein